MTSTLFSSVPCFLFFTPWQEGQQNSDSKEKKQTFFVTILYRTMQSGRKTLIETHSGQTQIHLTDIYTHIKWTPVCPWPGWLRFLSPAVWGLWKSAGPWHTLPVHLCATNPANDIHNCSLHCSHCHWPLIDPLLPPLTFSLSLSLFSYLSMFFLSLYSHLFSELAHGRGINRVFVFFSAVFPKERCWICVCVWN